MKTSADLLSDIDLRDIELFRSYFADGRACPPPPPTSQPTEVAAFVRPTPSNGPPPPSAPTQPAKTPRKKRKPNEETMGDILRAFLQMGATSSEKSQKIDHIGKLLESHGGSRHITHEMVELKKRGLTVNQTSPGGGCWLTERGKIEAERLTALKPLSKTT